MIEDFSDLCNPLTLTKIQRNISFYSDPENFDQKALDLFRGLEAQAAKQCKLKMRSLNGAPIRTLVPSQRKFTMRGFEIYEIHPDGSLSIIPEPAPEPKIPDGEPEWKLRMMSRNQDKIKKR